jgi:hypothetical protein
MLISKELKELFAQNLPMAALTDPPNYDDCWPWMGAQTGDSYGSLWYMEKQHPAHRISYILFNGNVPEGFVVRHTCDNPSCVNPNHLILGTQSDNIIDALKRGRLPNHSLNETQVLEIKQKIAEGDYYGLYKELADKYNVNRKAIYKIKAGITWKHVQIQGK